MKPYYEDDYATIYCDDARGVVGFLGGFDCIITDPVWPNAKSPIQGREDPHSLLYDVLHEVKRCRGLALQFGVDSDPRILMAVPWDWPFFRACWLEYGCPTYKGRVLYSGDVAYLFGRPPKASPGRMVIPGKCSSARSDARRRILTPHVQWGQPLPGDHPCPRRLDHVQWLVKIWADGPVLDPFMGSGTTLVAAKAAGRKCIGIEIEERFCEMAVNRLKQETLIPA